MPTEPSDHKSLPSPAACILVIVCVPEVHAHVHACLHCTAGRAPGGPAVPHGGRRQGRAEHAGADDQPRWHQAGAGAGHTDAAGRGDGAAFEVGG